jgi:hypothetical protein
MAPPEPDQVMVTLPLRATGANEELPAGAARGVHDDTLEVRAATDDVPASRKWLIALAGAAPVLAPCAVINDPNHHLEMLSYFATS